MVKKTTFLFLFIFLNQPSLRTSSPQDDCTNVSHDIQQSNQPLENEYHDELDDYADRQDTFLEEPTGATAYAKNLIYTHMPVWAKKLLCSLIIALDQASEYASSKWDSVKKSLPL